jgi:uncharacterized membrane protein YczE
VEFFLKVLGMDNMATTNRENIFEVIWAVLTTLFCGAIFLSTYQTAGTYNASVYTLIVFIIMVIIGIVVYRKAKF